MLSWSWNDIPITSLTQKPHIKLGSTVKTKARNGNSKLRTESKRGKQKNKRFKYRTAVITNKHFHLVTDLGLQFVFILSLKLIYFLLQMFYISFKFTYFSPNLHSFFFLYFDLTLCRYSQCTAGRWWASYRPATQPRAQVPVRMKARQTPVCSNTEEELTRFSRARQSSIRTITWNNLWRQDGSKWEKGSTDDTVRRPRQSWPDVGGPRHCHNQERHQVNCDLGAQQKLQALPQLLQQKCVQIRRKSSSRNVIEPYLAALHFGVGDG